MVEIPSVIFSPDSAGLRNAKLEEYWDISRIYQKQCIVRNTAMSKIIDKLFNILYSKRNAKSAISLCKLRKETILSKHSFNFYTIYYFTNFCLLFCVI